MFFIKIISKCLENLFAFLYKFVWFFVFFIMIIFGFSGCVIEHPIDKYKAIKLSNEWGGLYVFDKDIRDEILEQERKRDEWYLYLKKTIQESNWTEEEKKIYRKKYFPASKRYPSILSNGCEYYWDDISIGYSEKLEPYYAKIREYMGDERYEKMKSGLIVTSYYVCEDEKQYIPITILYNAYYSATEIGFFYSDIRGFYFTKQKAYPTNDKETIKYLVNGKFIEDKSIKGVGWR